MKRISATLLLAMAALAAHAQLAISIGVRETNTSAAIGANGGTSGTIEWIDLDLKTFQFNGLWQKFSFFMDDALVTGFTGNGALTGSRGVLENIRIRNTGGWTGPTTLYIDSVVNQTATGTFTLADFENFNDGTEVMFQDPRFSGSTSANLLATPNTNGVSSLAAFEGSKSYRIQYQFVDNSPTRWIRLTTNAATNLPNPTISFESGSVVSFYLMSPTVVPEPGTLAALGLGALALARRRKNRR